MRQYVVCVCMCTCIMGYKCTCAFNLEDFDRKLNTRVICLVGNLICDRVRVRVQFAYDKAGITVGSCREK